MKKTILLLVVIMNFMWAVAQSGNNQFIPALQISIPTGDLSSYKTGIGVAATALFGVGERAQIGGSTGYTVFKQKGNTDAVKQKLSVIPIVLTYRYKLPVVYLEPRLGYGIYTSTTKTEVAGTETKQTRSRGGFTWSAGGGVQLSALDLGVRFEAGHPSSGTIGFFGFYAGYIFSSRNR